MRKIATELDADVQPTQVEPVRAVTTEFTYESQAGTTAVGTTTVGTTAGTIETAAFDPALNTVTANLSGLVFDQVFGKVIVGTEVADIIHGGAGNNLIDGRGGDDFLHGNIGNDTVLGGAGNDWVSGWGGDDALEGGIGSDRLEGHDGNDIMNGGEGSDILVDGSGIDVMSGGAGRDKFVLHGGHAFAGGVDKITDFEGANGYVLRDKIVLGEALKTSGFTGSTVNEAFEQGYIYLVQHGTPGEEGFGTTIYMDRNGNAPDNIGWHIDVALVDVVGVSQDQLQPGGYNTNFIL